MKIKLTSLDDLVSEYGIGQVPYARLLEASEWQKRREDIVRRDGECCTQCKKAQTTWISAQGWASGHYWIKAGEFDELEIELSDKAFHLEVHHRFYIHNRYPWDYPDTALLTLCNWCHQNLHQAIIVPYYNHEGESLGYAPCLRCAGAGSFSEYTHVQSGVCFRCGGARYEELIKH